SSSNPSAGSATPPGAVGPDADGGGLDGDGSTTGPGNDGGTTLEVGAACSPARWSHVSPTTFTGDHLNQRPAAWLAVTTGADNAVYATGRHSGSADLGDGAKGSATASSMRLAKWNKDGSVAWSKTYDAQYATAGSAVVSDPSGGVYFGGAVEGTLALGDGKSVQGASLNPKAFVAKVGATGQIAWALTLTDNDERIDNLVLSGSKLFALVADYPSTYEPEKTADGYRVARINAATGTLEDTTFLSGLYYPLQNQHPKLATSPDGGVFVSYQTQNGLNDYPAQLVKIDAASAVSWTRSFSANVPGTAPHFAILDIAADGAGGVVAITAGELAGYEDPSVSRYDASGTLSWSRKIEGLPDATTYGGVGIVGGVIRVLGIPDTATCGMSDVAEWTFSMTGVAGATSHHPFAQTIDTTYYPFHASFGPTTAALTGTLFSSYTLLSTQFPLP
ncbi:MAG: Tryptophan synthase alpha chain, partial [Myxococcaceae bacterium]|nr:Tryptophan synthase alpha chain [Myxococcaceae bacterium]